MNERARTCAYIECDDDLYMSLSVHTIAPSLSMHVLRASVQAGKKGGCGSDDDDDDDVA